MKMYVPLYVGLYESVFIPVTRRVKLYTRFFGRTVTDRRKRFRPHKVYIFLIRITCRVDLAMSVCSYERWDLGNYKSYITGIRHAGSWDSCVAQVCFSRVPRPLLCPQTAQNSSSYSFYARIKILAEMYCSHQYLSIDPKKVCHAQSNAHKPPKPVAPTIFMLEKKF